ncbi:uncharacterized protein A4U43_C05F31530 [Asparagus officinalis]|uniref:Trichome birefringence-like C-terminal domain-containing protein n=2 Tax=Asparagus officinalis TaxID=4686 RepID=A0A5P1EXP2_ASPOF|nr:uncharacterized protein A4U43_C05F31530 [Asparagus officinalis]
MKYGRPDNEFMKWRWKPDQCELPIFNPAQFLEIVRGKSMAFVGDSLGRNHMQALMCQLLRVTYVEDVSPTTDYKSRTWLFRAHDFTLANFWSPFLVNANEAEPNGDPLNGVYNLYLDEPDKNWTMHINKFDYVIISAGQWFFRPVIYYENNKLIGCYSCNQANINNLPMYYGYARAFRTSFKALYGLNGFKGMTFLRTFSPAHFENGEWNKGGNCIRKTPFKSNETSLRGFMLETYMTQIEEFKDAAREAKRRGLKFRLLDITEVMLLRADGHPSIYGHWPHEKVLQYNDCVHWCLPGPVDVWNDFMLEILKMESLSSFFSHIAKRAKNEP